MRISEVMSRNVESVKASDPVAKVAKMMRDFNVGAIPVIEGNRVSGIITDRDLVIRAMAADRNISNTLVKEVMTKNAIACSEEDDVRAAAKVMEECKIRRLLVKDVTGKISGIVSLGDFAIHGEREVSEAILEKVSAPSGPTR